MAEVVRKDLDALNATLEIKLPAAEYGPIYTTELKKIREKVNMKGFRPGKAPMGMVRKMYGGSVLSETIDKEINKALSDYLIKEKVTFLGSPVASEKQEEFEFDTSDLKDFVISFDLGLMPTFEVQGLDEKTKFTKYSVKVGKETLDKEILNLLKRFGKQEPTKEAIVEDDILRISAVELDGRKAKEGGHESNFSVSVKDLATDAAKKLIGKKTGASATVNIFEFEAKADRAHTLKHLLQVEEGDAAEIGEKFKVTVDEVIRLTPAEPSAEVFEQYFGADRAKTEEEARSIIEADIVKFYDNQADGILFKQVQKHLLETHQEALPLPDEFLKRWLHTRNEDIKDPEERMKAGVQIEADYPLFAEDLRWRLIKEKLMERYEIKVEEQHIRNGFRSRFANYLGAMQGNEELIESTIDRAMENREQVESVQQEVISELIFEQIKDNIKLSNKSVNEDKFEELQKEFLPQR